MHMVKGRADTLSDSTQMCEGKHKRNRQTDHPCKDKRRKTKEQAKNSRTTGTRGLTGIAQNDYDYDLITNALSHCSMTNFFFTNFALLKLTDYRKKN